MPSSVSLVRVRYAETDKMGVVYYANYFVWFEEIRAEGRMLSAVRVEFTYEVVRKGESAISASGRTVHAAVDPAGRPCRLPERIRQVFA
jgi:acyl-CoA thioesterase FadM